MNAIKQELVLIHQQMGETIHNASSDDDMISACVQFAEAIMDIQARTWDQQQRNRILKKLREAMPQAETSALNWLCDSIFREIHNMEEVEATQAEVEAEEEQDD